MNTLACGLAVSLAMALGSSEEQPAHPVETIVQDDAQMLHRPPSQVRRAARRLAELGVDRVRLTASWSGLAPRPDSRRRPRFDAGDSRSYPAEAFERLDRAVAESREAGLDVMIDLAFFAPRWATSRGAPRAEQHRWRPSPREFGLFTRAVAERYSGHFREGGRRLPAVRLWTTWNEPNHATFLRPQWEGRRGSRRPAAPHVYRRLHEASYQQLKAVSPSNRVLIGGLASFGAPGRRADSTLGPLRFTRELACVDRRLRPLRRRACRRFKPLRADGFAHHPYSNGTGPGDVAPALDRVQMGELDKLTNLLDALHDSGRLAQPLPLYLTEYGYESRPPDPHGVPLETHARYLGEATFLAWRRPEVRSYPQFLLQDIGPDPTHPVDSPSRWHDFQTGLLHHDGSPKPAVLQAFRLPFHAEVIEDARGHREVVAFGQVRPGRGVQRVRIERLTAEGWQPEASLPGIATRGGEDCAGFHTTADGYYGRRLLDRGTATYRAVWTTPSGDTQESRPVEVGPVKRFRGGSAEALRAPAGGPAARPPG
jgi:hypothetical protein